MMRYFISMVPRGIAGQIVALVVCGVLVFQPPFVVFFRLFHERPPNPAAAIAERLTAVVQMIDRATPLSRFHVLQAANDASPSFAFFCSLPAKPVSWVTKTDLGKVTLYYATSLTVLDRS